MVFTLVTIYITFYVLILLSIFGLIFSNTLFSVLSVWSLGNLMLFLQKYKSLKTLYFWLFFSLTGLPPVGLFFVKFNIFFSVLNNTHIISSVIMFLFFFLNMLFYSQIFSFKNHKKSLYHTIGPDMFSYFRNTKLYSSNFSKYTTYFITIFSINVLFFLFLTGLFLSDYYLIISFF